MTGTRRIATAVALGAMLGTQAFVAAQSPRPGAARHVRTAPIQAGRRLVDIPILNEAGSFSPLPSSRGMTVFGIVQNHAGILVPNAGRVIIRDLFSGRVLARTAVNHLAEYSVRGLPPGVYTAELVNDDGNVIASSPAFTATDGEVIQLAQTIPNTPPQGIARAIRSATMAALSTAAGSGVLAIAPGAPVTPGS